MPLEAWSHKRERPYEHIKEGLTRSGRSRDEAEEIAARTANKERRISTSQAFQDVEGAAPARGRPPNGPARTGMIERERLALAVRGNVLGIDDGGDSDGR